MRPGEVQAMVFCKVMVYSRIELIAVRGCAPAPCVSRNVQPVAEAEVVRQGYEIHYRLNRPGGVCGHSCGIAVEHADGLEIPCRGRRHYRVSVNVDCGNRRVVVPIDHAGKESKDSLPCCFGIDQCGICRRPLCDFPLPIVQKMKKCLVP